MSEQRHTLWLVPQGTKRTQCLSLLITTNTNETIEIIASEYQCLYGHRCSHLLIEMSKRCGDDCNESISLVEDDQINILQALMYIHSDTPEIVIAEYSPLILGQTAHYLKISHLCRYIASEASQTLSYALDLAFEPGILRMSVWDAIALLHLLGDTTNLLPSVQLSQWCQRFVLLHLLPFSSRSHRR
jgi:hypothetical protein